MMNDVQMWCALLCSNGMVSWRYSSMESTRSTTEARAEGRPHACWRRDRSRNTEKIITAMGRHNTYMVVMATAISMAIIAGKRQGFSPTWKMRLLMSKWLIKNVLPPWGKCVHTPSAGVSSSKLKRKYPSKDVEGRSPFYVLLLLCFHRLHSPGAAVSRDKAGRRLDLPGSTGNHHGSGQLDNGLC